MNVLIIKRVLPRQFLLLGETQKVENIIRRTGFCATSYGRSLFNFDNWEDSASTEKHFRIAKLDVEKSPTAI